MSADQYVWIYFSSISMACPTTIDNKAQTNRDLNDNILWLHKQMSEFSRIALLLFCYVLYVLVFSCAFLRECMAGDQIPNCCKPSINMYSRTHTHTSTHEFSICVCLCRQLILVYLQADNVALPHDSLNLLVNGGVGLSLCFRVRYVCLCCAFSVLSINRFWFSSLYLKQWQTTECVNCQ